MCNFLDDNNLQKSYFCIIMWPCHLLHSVITISFWFYNIFTQKGFEIEWLANNDMKFTTQVLPAIRYNDRKGRLVWFNSSFLCYESWIDERNDRTKSVLFPNGDQMPQEAMKTLNAVSIGINFTFFSIFNQVHCSYF